MLEGKILEVEEKLPEASEEMWTLRWKSGVFRILLELVLVARRNPGDQSSMGRAGGSQKKRRAAEWKGSAEMQDYESCQQNDTEVDVDENKEELSLFPSAVSDSVGWHEPRFMCYRQCRREDFKFYDVRRVDDGGRRRRAAHDQLLQFEARRKESTTGQRQAMEDHGPRKELLRQTVGLLAAKGLENKMWECFAVCEELAE